MKIGIDARFYGSLGKGLGRYTSELIKQLERIDTENEYVIFLRRDNWEQYEPQNRNFRKVLAEYKWYGWREQFLYPFFLFRYGLDLMHFPHFNVPLLYRKPFVVTVHDLILLQFPTVRATTLSPLLYKLKFAAYRHVIGSALKRARGILTVSKTTRKEIIKHFPGTKRKQIVVTYNACAPQFQTRETGKSEGASSCEPFILYVGNAYPHKNLEHLVNAFQKFRLHGHEEWKLILVGSRDYFYGRLQKETLESDRAENVIFYGHASDEQLSLLYRTAKFYAFPSLCEGFGVPPLEAMCNGLPVASSKASCMPEILKDAAVYFDATDIDDTANALSRLADDKSLRDELTKRGHELADEYDWETTAIKTLNLYRSCSNK